jgi:hypothetical protein
VLALEDGRELATTNLPGESCVDAALTDRESDSTTQLRAGSFTALACGDQMRADSSRPTAAEVVLVEVASGDVLARSDLPNDLGTCQVWPVATATPTVVRWGQDCGPPALLAADDSGGLDEAEIAPPEDSTPNCGRASRRPCVEGEVVALDDDTVVLGLTWDMEQGDWARELVAVGTEGEIRWRTERSAWRPLVTRYGIVVRARDWALLSPEDGRELASAPEDPLERDATDQITDGEHIYSVSSVGGIVVRNAEDLSIVESWEGGPQSSYPPAATNGVLFGFFDLDPEIVRYSLMAYGEPADS